MGFGYFKNILPKVLIVILFFIITIIISQYLGLSFKEKDNQVLTKIITVETLDNKNESTYDLMCHRVP